MPVKSSTGSNTFERGHPRSVRSIPVHSEPMLGSSGPERRDLKSDDGDSIQVKQCRNRRISRAATSTTSNIKSDQPNLRGEKDRSSIALSISGRAKSKSTRDTPEASIEHPDKQRISEKRPKRKDSEVNRAKPK